MAHVPLGKNGNSLLASCNDVSDISWPMAGVRFFKKLLQTLSLSNVWSFPIPKTEKEQCLQCYTKVLLELILNSPRRLISVNYLHENIVSTINNVILPSGSSWRLLECKYLSKKR